MRPVRSEQFTCIFYDEEHSGNPNISALFSAGTHVIKQKIPKKKCVFPVLYKCKFKNTTRKNNISYRKKENK